MPSAKVLSLSDPNAPRWKAGRRGTVLRLRRQPDSKEFPSPRPQEGPGYADGLQERGGWEGGDAAALHGKHP